MPATREELDTYLGRTYKGKPWRRMTKEEIEALGDSELLGRLKELEAIHNKKKNGEEAIIDPSVWLPNEVKPNESRELWGPNGDIPDDISNEQMDEFIDKERKRIYSVITAPPRSEKYLHIFQAKYPDVDINKLRNGFVLSKDGVDSPEWSMIKDRQEKRHIRARKLSHAEVSQREAISGPEKTEAIGHADFATTARLHAEIYANSDGVSVASLQMPAPGRIGGAGMTRPAPFEVMEDDHYIPEEDSVKPIVIPFGEGEEAELPSEGAFAEAFSEQQNKISEMSKAQRDKLKETELDRGIPSKVAV